MEVAGARALPALPGWAGLHRTDRNAKLKEESAVIYWTGAKNQGQSDSIACVFFRADKIYEGKAIGVESEAVRETENRCLERRAGPGWSCSGGVLGSGWSWLQGVERRGWLTKINQTGGKRLERGI